MLKILALSYSELLLITTHCSWIVKKIKNNNNNNLYSHQLSLLSSLSSLTSLSPMVVVQRWLSVMGRSLMVQWSRCGSWVTVRYSWVMGRGH